MCYENNNHINVKMYSWLFSTYVFVYFVPKQLCVALFPAICQAGYYFDMPLNRCEPCALGFYQNETGQFTCKWCGASYTTENTASTSINQCSSKSNMLSVFTH